MRTNRTLLVGLVLAGTLSACADHAYDPTGPAQDPNAPLISITSPARGGIVGNVATVTVTGTATDDTAVASVTVNGVPASLAQDGTWTVNVPVTAGTYLLHAIATDSSGNEGKASQSVVAGPMSPLNTAVTDAITASLSKQTFAAIGKGAAGFITTADLTTMVAPMNPVINDGAPNGPDCLYVLGSVTSLTVGGATIDLEPRAGGMYIDAELQNVAVGMHLSYAAACISGSRDITVSASNVSIKGPMTIAAADGKFDVALNSPDVTFTNFDLELGGIPGDVVDMFDMNAVLGPVLGWAVEKFMTPVINNAFAGLNSTKTVDVMGTPVAVSMTPDTVDFETTGAIIKLDTSMRAQGDSGGPGYVNVTTTTPTMNTAQGFELAIAQGAADQLLASLWAAHGLDKTFDLTTGSYGAIGTLYTSVQIQTLAMPYIDATGTGLKLTLGDLMVSFMNGETLATQIAVNAEVDVTVSADPTTGALSLNVGNPTTYVDVLADHVQGANQLSNETFDAITSFALSRVVSYGSAAVGAIPLPTIGGVSVGNVSVAAQTGYMVVDGTVQ